MRAVVIDGFGGRETLRLTNLGVPEPGPDEIRVKLAYAAANPADWKFREGWGKRFATVATNFPLVLGLEGVGRVDKVGANVVGVSVGDRVAMRWNQRLGATGCYAEYAITSADSIAIVPPGVSLEEAATVPIAAVTAYQALVFAGVTKGMLVLVHGAAGGVGGFATQFAHDFGAQTLATCSGRNTAYVRSLGADHVIDYAGSIDESVRALAPGGVDILIDCVGLHSLADPLSLLKPGGFDVRIATLTPSDAESPTEAEAAARGVRATVKYVDSAMASRDMAAIFALMAAKRVRAPEIEILPLDQVSEAHRRLEERQVRGKLLLSI